MKRCPKCKKDMSDRSLFCNICGAELEETISPEDTATSTDIVEATSPHEIEELEAYDQPSDEKTDPKVEKSEKVEEFVFENATEDDSKINSTTKPSTKLKRKSNKTQTVPETVPETTSETVPETVPETTSETVPETVPETTSEIVLETVPETTSEIVPETVSNTGPVIESIPAISENQPEVTAVSQQVVDYSTSPVVLQPAVVYPTVSVAIPSVESTELSDEKHDIRIRVSFIIGIISLLLGGMWPLAFIGLIIGFLSPENSKKKTNAMLINAIAMALGVFVMIVFFSVIQSDQEADYNNMNRFYGEGYSIAYSDPWKETMAADDTVALKYGSNQSFFYPIGESNLDITINCDFNLDSCKTVTYNNFYEYWRNLIDDTMVLSKDSSFLLLKDDIYYATYNYSLKEGNVNLGKYYLLISKKKNSVLSFITSAEEPYLADLNPKVIKLLNTIEIQSKPKHDKNQSETMEQFSNWNLYADLRKDAQGRKTDLDGSYRILADTTSFWVFKDGKFWWYKSEETIETNYWYGSYSVKTGKSGLKSIGLDESYVDKLLKKAQGKISKDDIYSIVMKPEKLIFDGVDKSDTNVRKGSKWKFVWIIIDHGDDGIEAQVLNAETYDASYFVKVSD